MCRSFGGYAHSFSLKKQIGKDVLDFKFGVGSGVTHTLEGSYTIGSYKAKITQPSVLKKAKLTKGLRIAAARALYKQGDLHGARDLYEKILTEDPYNQEATKDLKEIYKIFRKQYQIRKTSDRLPIAKEQPE